MTSFPESIPESLLSTGTAVSDKSERKRRDNINERIQELLNVIPKEFFQDYYNKKKEMSERTSSSISGSGIAPNNDNYGAANATTITGGSHGNGGSSAGSDNENSHNVVTGMGKSKGTGTRDGKPNKGQILTQAVEYLTYLQGQIDLKNREEVELILKIKELSKVTGTIPNDINLENTSAEIALAKIGVGPLAGVLDDYYLTGNTRNQNQLNTQYHPQRLTSNQNDSTIAHTGTTTNYQDKNNNFEYGGYSEYGELDSLNAAVKME